MKEDKEIQTQFYDSYRAAIAFPDNNHYHPVNGKIIGIENNLKFHSFRYIFKYDSKPIRKSNNKEESWTNGLLFLDERDVKLVN